MRGLSAHVDGSPVEPVGVGPTTGRPIWNLLLHSPA